MIYLDHAASTSLSDEALDVLINSSREDFANPSSSHKFGKSILKKIEISRKLMLEFLKAGELYDLYFTSSATESNNTVIKGLEIGGRDVVFVSRSDHPSLQKPVESLLNSHVNISYIPMKGDGSIDDITLKELLSEDVKLVIFSHVNNQSGHICNVSKIASEIKKSFEEIHIHVDGVQSFCKIPFSLKSGVIDSYSVASHKIGGAKGVAALYLRKNSVLKPLLSGGGQEGGLRSSTHAAPLILSFGEAVKYLSDMVDKNFQYVKELNLKARKFLEELIPNIIFPFSGEDISPYILNLIIPGISSDIIIRHLEEKSIFISSTSACSSGGKEENPVFKSLGIPVKYHNFVYRVSFSYKSKESEVKMFCETIASIYGDLSDLL